MWQCSNCGTTNSGNLCRQCGLPAYRADARFEDNLNAGEYDLYTDEQPAQEHMQAYRRPKKKKSKAAWFWCLLALVLSAVCFWQTLQPIYRFSFAVDTENISQTLESVLDYVDFDLVGELGKLNFDGTYSIQELYKPDGKATQISGNLSTLMQQAEDTLHYLQKYGYADAGESINTGVITRPLGRLTLIQGAIKAVVISLGVIIALALILLLFGKAGAARSLIAFATLMTAAAPVLACTVLNKLFSLVGDSLNTITSYGIGFRASFALNGTGLAVILLSALALVFVLFSRLAKALSR